jgi:hypothetical protein
MQQIVTVDELQRADAALGDSYGGLSSFERLTQTAVNVLVACAGFPWRSELHRLRSRIRPGHRHQ